jgi:type III pantothenate kinase
MPHAPVLALDVGNTSVKCAALVEQAWQRLFRTAAAPADTLAERLLAAFPQELAQAFRRAGRCVACSVHPAADPAVASFWSRLGGQAPPQFFGRDLPIPIPTCLSHPERVGPDRLLLALGGKAVAGSPCIVVSAGTAITVDLVDAQGRFAGGAIAPGLGLACAALHEKTGLLPLVEPAAPEQVPGKDTQEAIRAGVYCSCAGGIAALIGHYRQTVVGIDRSGGRLAPVVCTGSDIALLLPALPQKDTRHEPDLIFQGMSVALELP